MPRLCFVICLLGAIFCRAADSPFFLRGYYMTFMRMPAFGLMEWRQMVDCIHHDGGNLLLLWTAGGFPSKKFPETWAYNRSHKNIAADFVRELIDYAHSKNIRVLLCFTPFAYDGVNQYSIHRPELRATGKDGTPATFWGMHSWGYNLCPSRPEAQRFMLEYAREMVFDFYPNADGLMIESSDYAVCHCAECREKFFVREFQFVKQISADVWKTNPGAMVVVYPHYFTGARVPGFEVRGATESFNNRWTLFFTPHSAHVDSNLLKQAKSSVYWTDGLTLGTPAKIREGARLAMKHGLTGFVPSCEPFTCPTGPPDNPGPPMRPFHFGWLKEGEMPLNELPVRINRIAYRAYARNPDLTDDAFRSELGRELFGAPNSSAVADAIFIHERCFQGADWFKPPPLLAGPLRVKLDPTKQSELRETMARLGSISKRYRNSSQTNELAMHRIAAWIIDLWAGTE